MRKLAIAACAFSLAVFAANYILPVSWLAPCAVICTAAGFLRFSKNKKLLKIQRIILFSLAFGLAWFFARAMLTSVPAAKLHGETRDLTAQVATFPVKAQGYQSIELQVRTEGIPRVRMLLYDYSLSLGELKPGQTVSFTAKLKRADLRWGESYDYYNAKDIFLIGDCKSEIAVIKDSALSALSPANIRKTVLDTVKRIFPKDTAPFMKALLAGDRTDYNRDTALKTAMSYAGFAHVIAVSGMHVAFLVGLITLLLGKSRFSSIICVALIWVFVLATGASPSAIRAGIMQSMLLAAPILRRENDAITSILAALAAILLINPFSATSISLQLSFGAMAGILCFAQPLFSAGMGLVKSRNLRRILKYPIGTAASSLAVLSFTAPLMAVYFGYMSILSPITNILGIWAVSFCFCGGYAACLLSLVPMLGKLAAAAVSWLARYIFFVARCVCSIPLSVVFFENKLITVWLIMLYVLAAWVLLGSKNRGRKLLYALLASVFVLAAALYIPFRSYRHGTGSVAAVDVGQGQSIAVLSGDKTVLVDCGATGSIQNAGEVTASYLRSRGRNKADLLILTHLHKDHTNGVTTLMELIPVEMLIIQENYDDTDGLLEEILKSAERHGTEVVFLSQDTAFSCGGINGELYMPNSADSENERCLSAKISLESYDIVITGDISSEAEKRLIAEHELIDAELLIVGHHGSKYSSCNEFLNAVDADNAIISVGYNTYGHPTKEVLERLGDCGYNVYRTDEDGTVEIRIG